MNHALTGNGQIDLGAHLGIDSIGCFTLEWPSIISSHIQYSEGLVVTSCDISTPVKPTK